MIYNFNTLDELEEAIIKDQTEFNISANRFPIRFIFLNSHEELKKIVNLLTQKGVKRIDLSSFLMSENGWFSPDEIVRKIDEISKTSVIVPFSEFIRFSDPESFTQILNSLAKFENKGIKLYIPLVGLWERFENLFWSNFYRKTEWAPIWKLETPSKQIKIYQIDYELSDKIKPNGFELISNTKEWFDLWKKDDINEFICLPKQLSIFYNNSIPDQTFTQDIINNPKEFLSKIYDMNINIEYNESDEKHWNELLFDIDKKNLKGLSFKDYFKEKFNIKDVNDLDELDYLDLYLEYPNYSYEKWIIKNFFIESKIYGSTYLYECFDSPQPLNENGIARKIFYNIFSLENAEDYFEERRELLSHLKSNKVQISMDEFENKFNSIENNYKKQLKYLTNTTLVEKEKILEIIHENGLVNIYSDIKKIFPELYNYMDWNLNFEDIPSWIPEYFGEYNKSKVLNAKTDKLNEILTEKNHPNEFYKWYYKINKISEHPKDNHVIWIDALGAEWLPLLTYYLNKYGEKYNKHVKIRTINSVNLPSATEFNKNKHDKKISALDEYIHKNHYKYPNSLLDEIELIKEIAYDIVSTEPSKVSIISDHGFSFLCTKHFGAKKLYNFKDASHEGRYLHVKNKIYNDDIDYLFTETESKDHDNQKFLVALRHNSLNNTPSHETHGGATPEEVLVPYIILENSYDSIEYVVSPLKNEINISKELELPIEISPEPNNLPVAICDGEKLEISKSGGTFNIHLTSSFNKGIHKFIIKIDDVEKEIDVMIRKGGMSTNDDDWF